ncbi:Putative F-box/LRR-repeat protein At3g18150, partial [Linum grandiflorum]
RRSGMRGGGGGVDIISNLPESILHHILSFLDTQTAVQTTLLSKHWISAWKYVHTLNLEVDINRYWRCETFVNNVLSLRYPLNVSQVVWNTDSIDRAPDGWEFSILKRVVQYALSHGAQHFILEPRYYNKHNIPLLELFDSASDHDSTVRTLELSWFDLDCRPAACSRFQLLTTLQLGYSRFLTDRELVEPFSQFPCLKDLVLYNCSLSWVSQGDDDDDVAPPPVRFRVSGLELRRLSLGNINASKFEIFAPKLTCLEMYVKMDVSELNLPCLVHADIGNHSDDDIEKEQLVFIFRGLHNVETLTLSKPISEAVREESEFLQQQPCPFTKLDKLNLEYYEDEYIPREAIYNYFFNGCSNANLNIQIQKEDIYQQVMIQRLS